MSKLIMKSATCIVFPPFKKFYFTQIEVVLFRNCDLELEKALKLGNGYTSVA